MIKTYNYNSVARLSDNFCASEFRCKCGKPHDILISTELVNGLQKLVGALGASKAIITSGYRCKAHDIAVKGNGNGQHTKGTAADVIFYDRAGKPISTKLVACKAQDIGFKGIANIDSTYTAIHLDVRSSGQWYGDEVQGTAFSVTSDFYSYYSIARTGNMIAELQTALNAYGARLAVDGIVGEKTLAAARKHIVDKGSTGEVVKWLQGKLNSLGYNCGAVDGIAGDKTMNAVYNWQSDHKLGRGYYGGSDWNYMLYNCA